MSHIASAPAAPAGIPLCERVASSLTRHFPGPFYCTPDGLQAPLLDRLAERDVLEYVVREDIALGMAAGACLGGRMPVVLMQNSGLGQSVNALASLSIPYGLPVLLVVGMRGTDHDDTAENTVMGEITPGLLRSLSIPVRFIPVQDPDPVIAAAAADLRAGTSSAMLIRPGLFGWSPAS